MGKIKIKSSTKNLISSNEHHEEWYPFQATKSGKHSSGALRVRLYLTKVKQSLRKKSTKVLLDVDNDVLKCIRNNDYNALCDLLSRISADEVNKPEDKTGNTPLHVACLESKTIDERILEALLDVCFTYFLFF